jgi:hypothetical protein
MPKRSFHLTKNSIAMLSGAGIGITVLVVTFVVLLKKSNPNATSTSTNTSSSSGVTYEMLPLSKFPDQSPYVVFTEAVTTGFGSVLTALEPNIITFNDANWCSSTGAQTWTFTYVKDGIDDSIKYYVISSRNQNMTIQYLVYNSATASKLDWGDEFSRDFWAVSYTGQNPVRTYSGNSAITLGCYRIRNLASGLSLTYSATSPTVRLSATVPTSQNQLFSLHKYTSC